MKIAIAQISTQGGDIKGNIAKIISFIKRARDLGADLVVFPELTIPGYMSLDLFLKDEFVRENLRGLEKIKKHTVGITTVVGFVDQGRKIGPDGTHIRYNSAAVIKDGKIIHVQDKTLLPDYDVFFENRYFVSARDRKVVGIGGVSVGIEICEDLWDKNYSIKVSQDLVSKGSSLLINISASPFYVGKRKVREKLIGGVARRWGIPFVYVNMVGAQDGYEGEIVFDGQSMVFGSRGELLARARIFEEDLLIVDLEKVEGVRVEETLSTGVEEVYRALALGIRDYTKRAGFNKVFIGISGGIDSAVTACLAVAALGKEAVVGISMPSRFSSEGSKKNARELASNLGIVLKTIAVERGFSAMLSSLRLQFEGLSVDTTEENIQARLRGMILMAFANKFKGLVLSTGNKTEMALGYTTLYGDMCGGLAVIADISKSRVYELAGLVNKQAAKELIPMEIIEKAPSAELKEGQTDEEGLGAPYSVLSPLVDEIVEKGVSYEELIKRYPREIVERTIVRIGTNEHKRRQAPPGIKITPKAFGVGRRMPMVHKFLLT